MPPKGTEKYSYLIRTRPTQWSRVFENIAVVSTTIKHETDYFEFWRQAQAQLPDTNLVRPLYVERLYTSIDDIVGKDTYYE